MGFDHKTSTVFFKEKNGEKSVFPCPNSGFRGEAFDSAKNHKRQCRKRQSVNAKVRIG